VNDSGRIGVKGTRASPTEEDVVPPSAERPLTLIRALKTGRWEAGRMAQQLDGDLLPEDCPVGGTSARRVWAWLRELQLAYQERDPGWREIPLEFERLARALHSLAVIGA
jgi:hypothetical protein